MLGLLDYCDVLLDLKVDSRLQAIYWRNQEALRSMEVDISSMECAILQNCFNWWGSSLQPSENNREECYRELCLIECADVPDSRKPNLWESVIYWENVGRELNLEKRNRRVIYALCAATMVIVGYAETLKAGIVSLDNQEVKSNMLFDIAFLLAETGFFSSSVLMNKKLRTAEKAAKSRQAGVKKSFKTKFFKESIVYPKWQALSSREIKRGDKADLIRTVVELYDIAVDEAKRQGQKITERESILTETTVGKWIREFELK